MEMQDDVTGAEFCGLTFMNNNGDHVIGKCLMS